VKICFVGNLNVSFQRRDYNTLAKKFTVNTVEIPSSSIGWSSFTFKLIKNILQSDVTFAWFAGWHATLMVFFSRLFNKKSLVVVGGYDAANVPEINYGAFTNLKEKIPAFFVLKYADFLLPVSKFTKNEILNKVKRDNIRLIYNGVNTQRFSYSKEKKRDLVITAGGVNKSNLIRKGISTFVKTAKYLPSVDFIVIGRKKGNIDDYLNSISSDNVKFTGYVSDDELVDWFKKASVICLLSYYEAFGMSAAEGMSCGCIPVLTKKRNAFKEFAGEMGYFVDYGNEKETADAIQKALNASYALRKKESKNISKNFSLERREKLLLKEIESLI
jgi:glycosyltransferase involved in cell wall biosynthesis